VGFGGGLLGGLYEITPGPEGDEERLIVTHENLESLAKVKKVLDEVAIDFELYSIKEVPCTTKYQSTSQIIRKISAPLIGWPSSRKRTIVR